MPPAPLIAVQPAYMHPFIAAKLVRDLAYLYRRRVHQNIVAGGFTGDLAASAEKQDVGHTAVALDIARRNGGSRA